MITVKSVYLTRKLGFDGRSRTSIREIDKIRNKVLSYHSGLIFINIKPKQFAQLDDYLSLRYKLLEDKNKYTLEQYIESKYNELKEYLNLDNYELAGEFKITPDILVLKEFLKKDNWTDSDDYYFINISQQSIYFYKPNSQYSGEVYYYDSNLSLHNITLELPLEICNTNYKFFSKRREPKRLYDDLLTIRLYYNEGLTLLINENNQAILTVSKIKSL